MNKTTFTLLLYFSLLLVLPVSIYSQDNSHPHLFFGKEGVDALRERAANDPVLNKMWRKFKRDRVDKAMQMNVVAPFDQDTGREYGDALADLSIAYIVTRDIRYVNHAKTIALDLADAPNWSEQLSIAHISIGYAFFWDFMNDHFSTSERQRIKDAAKNKSANFISPNQLSNHNWTPSAAEGLLGLAFRGEISSARILQKRAKDNFKEAPRSVLWAHGADGFSPQGLGYWRKYNQVALFFKALRHNEPHNDWFRLGKEFPGSEFLEKTAYPRIYTDVQHRDMSCISWGDSRQIGNEKKGPYTCMGMLALAASEYQDGYVMDFLKTIVDESRYRFEDEDAAAFIFYDPAGVPTRSYRDLPLSGYWPNMEGAVFRSGWDKDDIVFFMRCGSQGGHAAKLKGLRRDGHSHPDANGFVLYYNNDYLVAEDGAKPDFGQHERLRITYGHNTLLVDGAGQRGDLGTRIPSTTANMDFLDAPHVGYLLGDATNAYANLDQFHRHVIYKKHKYFIIVDEIRDDSNHKYEFLLGTDKRHFIRRDGNDKFDVRPTEGQAKLPIIFVEPRNPGSNITTSRPYAFGDVLVDLLSVSPAQKSRDANFFALLYPQKENDPDPAYTKIYDNGLSGIVVDGSEYFIYNQAGSPYSYRNLTTDAKLSYHNDVSNSIEYLAAGSKELYLRNLYGFTSTEPIVAAFQNRVGRIRLGKNLGTNKEANITLFYPEITGLLVDGQVKSLVSQTPGSATFKLSPKQYKTGPTGYEQTVTDNYAIEILAGDSQRVLHVVRPNGGESFTVGNVERISWNSDGGFSKAKVEYSTDAGLSWKLIRSEAENDGNDDWIVPNDTSDSCLVRVSDVADTTFFDVSDNFFAIIARDRNRAPVAADDSITTAIGVAAVINVLANDRDPDGVLDKNSVLVGMHPSHGTVTAVSDSGLVIYTPNPDFTGIDSFTYTVEDDSSAVSNVAAVVITVTDLTTTTSFRPTDDGYVKLTNQGVNFGGRPSAKVKKDKFVSYFKFDVSGISGPVQAAHLRLFVTGASDDGGAVYLVSNSFAATEIPWKEADLTAANAPEISGTPIGAAGMVSENIFVDFDVSAAVTGAGIHSFALRNNSIDEAKYSTKEDNRPPELMVTFSGNSSELLPENFTGVSQLRTTMSKDSRIPQSIVLNQNYPNPFNAETTIRYALPEDSHVRLSVYNLRGQRIRGLVEARQAAGIQEVKWDGRNENDALVGTGLYFIELVAGEFRLIEKVILQK